jgi:hypothetical protein
VAADEDLLVRPISVRKHFTRAFSGSKLARTVEQMVDDPTRQQVHDFRDFMTHRGALPREHVLDPRGLSNARIPEDVVAVYVRAHPKGAVDSKARIKLDAHLGTRWRQWLNGHLMNVLGAAAEYCRTHPFPSR